MGSETFAFELCLELLGNTVPKRGCHWSSGYTVESILLQLQNLMEQEQFNGPKKDYGNDFAKLLRDAHNAADKYTHAELGHSKATPWPPIATFNGPFADGKSVYVDDAAGAVTCKDTDNWHFARCEPTSSVDSTHTFRAVICSEGPCRLGFSSSSCNSKTPFGEDDDGVCLDQDGQLLVCGVGSNASVRFGQWDVVECSVDYDEGCIKFAVNGTPIDESVSLADNPALKYPLCPALAIKAPCAVELQLFGSQTELLTCTAAAASPRTEDQLCCFFRKTRLGEDDCVLGIGVHVEREKATIKELTSSWDLLSQSAFTEDKVRRGPNGDKFEFFLPLPFGEDHCTKAMKTIQTTLIGMSRDPSASTLYTPPFRPAMATKLMPKLMSSMFSSLQRVLQNSSFCQRFSDRLLFGYHQLHYLFLAIVSKHAAVVKESQQVLQDCMDGKLPLTSSAIGPRGPQHTPLDALGAALVCEGTELLELLPAALRCILNGSKGIGTLIFRRNALSLKMLLIQLLVLQNYSDNTLDTFHESLGVPSEHNKDAFYAACQSIMEVKDWKGFCQQLQGASDATVMSVVAEFA
jgi:hypothetical protein